LYIDVDRLKSINDYLGHSAGDWFIRVFAQRLCVKVGRLAMIARIGGDEFVVVPNQPMSAHDAESFARQLQTMMQDGVLIGGELVNRTTSIGVAVGIPGHDSASDLLRQADQGARELTSLKCWKAALERHVLGGHRDLVASRVLGRQGNPLHTERCDYPLIFDDAGSALWQARAKRCASKDQLDCSPRTTPLRCSRALYISAAAQRS
jgi:diguanylate cyclase (GGDEF)-like protein